MGGAFERSFAIGQDCAVAGAALFIGPGDRPGRGHYGNLRRVPSAPRSVAFEEAEPDVRVDRKGVAACGNDDHRLATDCPLGSRPPQELGFRVGTVPGTAPPGLSDLA